MYHDSLIRIKNAQAVKKDKVKIPYSELDFNILETLKKSGFIGSVLKKGRSFKKVIDVELLYDGNKKPVISGLKFYSRPSKKIYFGYQKLKPVRQGFGLGIISTPKGVMSSIKARKEKVGGEYLFEIW